MKGKILFGDSMITYTITKSKRRKTSQIIVDAKGVEVKTPLTKKDTDIRSMMDGKKEWIFKKRLEFAERTKRTKIKLKSKTPEYLEKRAWILATKMNVKPSKIIVRYLKSRWGSSGISGQITLNQALTRVPPRIIDYVIIHELCHLEIKNHSGKFWNLVYTHDKKYKSKISWLENNSDKIL